MHYINTRLHLSFNTQNTEQLGAAKRTAINKTNKHIANAEYIHANFVPFILESYDP